MIIISMHMLSHRHFKWLTCLLILSVFATSCKKDDESEPEAQSLNLSFYPKYEGQDLQLFKTYNNIHNCSFEFRDLKFYIAHISLHLSNGDSLELSEIELMDIRNGKQSLTYDMPAGQFVAISFGLGVPQHLNGTDNPDFLTSVYSLDHPLSGNNGTYWTWATGYRFFMTEGRFDTVPDVEAPTRNFSYHTGPDVLYRHVGPFAADISAAGRSQLNFALDMERFWATETDTVNLRLEREFHGTHSIDDLGHRLANNSAATFRLMP